MVRLGGIFASFNKFPSIWPATSRFAKTISAFRNRYMGPGSSFCTVCAEIHPIPSKSISILNESDFE